MLNECVYFTVAEDIGQIKIGRTNDIDRRLTQLSTACPHRLKLLCTVAGDADTEAMCQRIWRHLRQSGEWFRSDPELVSFAIALSERQPFSQRALTNEEVEVRQINAIMKAWNKAGRGARRKFLELVEGA